jgi:parallel beta-helix repeat protein
VALFRGGKGGTENNWKMLTNYPGHAPKIEYTSQGGISIAGSSYVIVSGFVVQGNSNNITYDYAYANRYNTWSDTINNSGIGVSCDWNDYSKRSHHVIIANNIVYRCSGAGILTHTTDYVQILNNVTCYNSYWAPNATSGISMYQNWNSDYSQDIKMIVRGNISYTNYNYLPFHWTGEYTDGNGIIIDDSTHTQHEDGHELKNVRYTGKTLIENNICFDNGGVGINIHLSEHVILLNNTVYQNLTHPEIAGGELSLVGSADIILFNNISWSKSLPHHPFHAYDSRDISMDCNLFYGGDPDAPVHGDHTITGQDPLFVNASVDPTTADFRLTNNSPAIDQCPTGAGTDIEGKKRSQGYLDMGAWEH